LVYERYKRLEGLGSAVADDGGQLNVRAGHFQVEWSQGDMKKGWLYYTPEALRMQFAAFTNFQQLNLSRFAHREQRTKR
jgi:hypothetical protein